MGRASAYHVYILASGRDGTLYIGVTNDLRTSSSSIGTVVFRNSSRNTVCTASSHVETFASPQEAIAREKQLKHWHRDWKIRLIEENNLDWSDLSHLL